MRPPVEGNRRIDEAIDEFVDFIDQLIDTMDDTSIDLDGEVEVELCPTEPMQFLEGDIHRGELPTTRSKARPQVMRDPVDEDEDARGLDLDDLDLFEDSFVDTVKVFSRIK